MFPDFHLMEFRPRPDCGNDCESDPAWNHGEENQAWSGLLTNNS